MMVDKWVRLTTLSVDAHLYNHPPTPADEKEHRTHDPNGSTHLEKSQEAGEGSEHPGGGLVEVTVGGSGCEGARGSVNSRGRLAALRRSMETEVGQPLMSRVKVLQCLCKTWKGPRYMG